MPGVTDAAAPVVATLAQREDDELFQELALRLKEIERNPSAAGDLALGVHYDAKAMGPLDALTDIGKQFFVRFNRDAYALICEASDAAERERITKAFGLGPQAVGGIVAGLLVAHLALAPAVAAVVAALVIRLFFNNAYTATCSVWKQRLPAKP